MTPAEYEKLVREIVESIATTFGVKSEDIGHGRGNRCMGASGYPHQIDVCVRGAKELVLIECKHWKKKEKDKNVSLEAVLVFIARVCDIQRLSAGMKIHAHIVSRNGFTRGALKVAKYFEVEPSQVRSPREFVLRYKDRWNIGVADDLNKFQDDVKTSLDPA
jgi:hypothetical protein